MKNTFAKSTPVLVLNTSYEPLNYASAQRAICMVIKGIALIEEEQEVVLNCRGFKLPCVVRLRDWHKPFRRKRELSRKNIYLRDNYTCQYCGESFHPSELTWDHVVPKSKGGRDVWENLVTACQPCNQKKGNRELHECKDMHLLHMPRPLTIHMSRHLIRTMGAANEKQRKYLYYN